MTGGPVGIVKPKWQMILDTLASAAIIVVCLALAWTLWGANHSVHQTRADRGRPDAHKDLPKEPTPLEGMSVLGSSDARVAIIEYSDFQCPFCKKFALEILPEIERRYIRTGKVLLAFRHRPLVAVHPQALKASEAAECAGQQGKFWEMHDLLFRKEQTLEEPGLVSRARDLGLREEPFRSCLQGQMTERVRQDGASASALAIAGTPSFLIGRVQSNHTAKITNRIIGAVPFESFQDAIEPLITATASSVK
jgi:protein-disulfide isomerase